MAYRDQAPPGCAFCADPAETRCPRCHLPVCALDRTKRRWCAVCQQELDELELEAAFQNDVAARAALVDEAEHRDAAGPFDTNSPRVPLVLLFVPYLLRRVSASFRRRALRRSFLARSPAQIAAWRNAAGIRLR